MLSKKTQIMGISTNNKKPISAGVANINPARRSNFSNEYDLTFFLLGSFFNAISIMRPPLSFATCVYYDSISGWEGIEQ